MDNHLVYMKEMKEKDERSDFFYYNLSFKNGDNKGFQLKAFEHRFS